jgi:hypothetical protein
MIALASMKMDWSYAFEASQSIQIYSIFMLLSTHRHFLIKTHALIYLHPYNGCESWFRNPHFKMKQFRFDFIQPHLGLFEKFHKKNAKSGIMHVMESLICNSTRNCSFSYAIDLTCYSLLPNGPVSMLTYFSMSGADKDLYIPMFFWTNLFLADLRLNNKVIFNPTKHNTWVSIWHENEVIG